MLREAEVRLSQGEKVKGICRGLGIMEQTYYRWHKDYGGMKVSQAKHLKELQRENGRLKKALGELTLDKLILKEALEGNCNAPPGAADALSTYGRSWRYQRGVPAGG